MKLRGMISVCVIMINTKCMIVDAAQCYSFLLSTCPNNNISAWNTKDVGENLKEWIKSLAFEQLGGSETTSLSYGVLNDGGRHCKIIVQTPYDFHYKHSPEVYSSYTTLLGKLKHNEDGSEDTKRKKFYGPVWADINDQHEWITRDQPQRRFVAISKHALLHNGLYYGILGNENIQLGR